MRKYILMLTIICASFAHAEGNYDPFSSKDPQERQNAAQMRDAAEKGDWRLAETFATTDALRRLYAQAKAEAGPAVSPAAGPGTADQRLDLLGDPATTGASRIIQIEPDTRHVNVIGGETIRFEVGGKSFFWSFSGPLSVTSFSLLRVAPAGLLDHDVTVYIASNPNYIVRITAGRSAG